MAYHRSYPVIDRYYCAPYHINLQINTDKGSTYDIYDKLIFHIKDTLFTLHHRRVLCDFQGNPIVTLSKMIKSFHGRWLVFRGKSDDPSELIFSVKRSSIIRDGNMIILEVFLAQNKNETVRDFRVNVFNGKSSCYVYAGESPTYIAKMENNGGFNVWIDPKVDHAFIVTLLMIIKEMKDYEFKNYLTKDMAAAIAGAALN